MYFPKDLENFGVVLKGASLSKLSKISDNFDHCFIVNNIDKNVDPNKTEYNLVAPNIEGKEIAHFVNRLPTTPLLKKHYLKLNIKHIQFSKTKLDFRLKKMKKLYESYGLTCHCLPKELLNYNVCFEGLGNFKNKHPNTGVLSIIYVAHILKPTNIWIIGLDLYQSDYLFRRPWQSPLKNQMERMDGLKMLEHFMEILKTHPNVNFKLVTNTSFPDVDNLEIIH